MRGITVRNGQAAEDIRARAAVILAGGGFPASREWRCLCPDPGTCARFAKYALTHYLDGRRLPEEGVEIARMLEAAGVDALTIDAGAGNFLDGADDRLVNLRQGPNGNGERKLQRQLGLDNGSDGKTAATA